MMTNPPTMDWRQTFRVEAITPSDPDVEGWEAFDLTLRPMDRLGRTNGRAKVLTTLKVGGPPGSVDLHGLAVGVKAEFGFWAGPAPTIRATLHPEAS